MTRPNLARPLAFLLALGTLHLAAPAQGASLAPAPDTAASVKPAADGTSSLIGAVTRRIRVDGRPVNISVSVANVLITTSAARSLPASVRVDLDSADGQDLPQINAVRVKLERVRPPVRIYRSPLYLEQTFAATPLHAGYAADLTGFYPGIRLNATVTLETPNHTRIIRVGEVRVRPPAPLANPTITP